MNSPLKNQIKNLLYCSSFKWWNSDPKNSPKFEPETFRYQNILRQRHLRQKKKLIHFSGKGPTADLSPQAPLIQVELQSYMHTCRSVIQSQPGVWGERSGLQFDFFNIIFGIWILLFEFEQLDFLNLEFLDLIF